MFITTKSSVHQPSKGAIVAWIRGCLPDVPFSLRVEELGKGTIYCRLINHYYPGSVSLTRVSNCPRSVYENSMNLKILQNSLTQLKINVHFDIGRVAQEKFAENLALVCSLYKHLNCEEMKEDSVSSYTTSQQSYKRSSDTLFQSELSYSQHLKPSAGRLSVTSHSSPNDGKWSVNSHMFLSNMNPILDRIKETLLKSSHDMEKIRQIKILLNIPVTDEVCIKVEEDETKPQILQYNNGVA